MNTKIILTLALLIFSNRGLSSNSVESIETCRFSVSEVSVINDRAEAKQKSVQLFWFDQSDALFTFTILSDRLASYLESLPQDRKFVNLTFETDDKGSAKILSVDELDWGDLWRDADLSFIHFIRNRDLSEQAQALNP